jgi:ABC-type lipoprotein release transport system permease subunit
MKYMNSVSEITVTQDEDDSSIINRQAHLHSGAKNNRLLDQKRSLDLKLRNTVGGSGFSPIKNSRLLQSFKNYGRIDKNRGLSRRSTNKEKNLKNFLNTQNQLNFEQKKSLRSSLDSDHFNQGSSHRYSQKIA